MHAEEALVLRTWPFHEADLLISLFTREGGKVKGVARHAMRSRKRFGGALEPGTHVRAHYTERPRQDLVRMDSFEVLWSPLLGPVDFLRAAGMQLVAEVLEEAMPDGAADDPVFRLAVTVLRAMQAETGPGPASAAAPNEVETGAGGQPFRHVWLPATYFCLWMNRLMGWWPELGHCAACGLDLRGEDIWWSPLADGVTCKEDQRGGSRRLSAQSVSDSYTMARHGLAQVALEGDWPRTRAADLRAFTVAVLERHLERRLRSASVLLG